MSNKRKQSITTDDVIDKKRADKLPAAGAPRVAGVEYNPAPVVRPEDNEETTSTISTLDAPRNLEVKSQSIRFAPDGTQYVTVVVEFDEVEGAVGYESRIAQA